MIDKLPFTAYDFFGYIASGFVLIACLFGSLGLWSVATEEPSLIIGFAWAVGSYVVGQLVAGVSGFVLQRWAVCRGLGRSEDLLFGEVRAGWLRHIFPGYFSPLPRNTQTRILQISAERAGIKTAGRDLFLHCHSVVKRDAAVYGRLGVFLNSYGFCRNICMATLVGGSFLLARDLIQKGGGHVEGSMITIACALLVVSVGMFYRYLKFYRQYTYEVFISYPEA